jgi:hypothetical protein
LAWRNLAEIVRLAGIHDLLPAQFITVTDETFR